MYWRGTGVGGPVGAARRPPRQYGRARSGNSCRSLREDTALEAVRLAVEPGQFRAGIRAYTTRMICSARSGAAVNTRSVVMKAVWLRMDEDTMPADTNVLCPA